MEINTGFGFEINLKELFHALLRKSWIIILAGILCSVGANFYSNYYLTPVYRSSAKLYIINRQPDELTTLYDLQTGSSLAKDFMILVKSRPVMEEVIHKLDLNMTSNALAGCILVYTEADTRVLQIGVQYPDPIMAKRLVDTVCEVSAERLVSIMGIEKVNIVEEGNYPYAPSGPNIRRNVILAGGAGIVVASFFIILFFLMNDSLKTAEDVEKYLGLTTLGFIPLVAGEKKKGKRKEKKLKVA
jgi:capsular polysaccharide biosynthesis protein